MSKNIKRVVLAVETPEKYTSIGIWGFTYNHINRKLKWLAKHEIYCDGAFEKVIDREVDKFPDYVTWRI